MNVGTLNIKFAEVNGTKQNRCVTGLQNALRATKKSNMEHISLPGSANLSMGVLSDDFAAIDVREKLC